MPRTSAYGEFHNKTANNLDLSLNHFGQRLQITGQFAYLTSPAQQGNTMNIIALTVFSAFVQLNPRCSNQVGTRVGQRVVPPARARIVPPRSHATLFTNITDDKNDQ